MLQKLKSDLMQAMKLHDNDIKACLQVVIANICNKGIELQCDLSDVEIIDIIKKEIKQLEETKSFAKDREDILHSCQVKIDYLSQYVPKQMTFEEVFQFVNDNIDSSCVSIGNAMKTILPKLKGKADNKMVSDAVKKFFTQK